MTLSYKFYNSYFARAFSFIVICLYVSCCECTALFCHILFLIHSCLDSSGRLYFVITTSPEYFNILLQKFRYLLCVYELYELYFVCVCVCMCVVCVGVCGGVGGGGAEVFT